MKVVAHLSCLLVCGLLLIKPSYSASIKKIEPVERTTEILDREGKYVLSWSIDEHELVTFEMVVETLGYVGLGISPNGQMTGADLFIAGVKMVDGEPETYSGDYYGVKNGMPVPDTNHSDWTLLEATENKTHTTIKASRLINTCDDQDFPITGSSTSRIIWSFGDTDDPAYHGDVQRGTKSVNLIPFPEPEVDIDTFTKWELRVNTPMPKQDTSYWCTLHQGPKLSKVHHVVGFDAFLPSKEALTHTHHFLVSKCTAPAGTNPDEMFGPHVDTDGAQCWDNDGTFPFQYCEQNLFVWAVGGKRTLFPLHAGYPIGLDEANTYYMVEIHYDNPKELDNVKFETGVDVYYTDKLRENEAKLINVGHDVNPAMIIPPNQSNYVVAGHCSAECTRAGIKEAEPLRIFNVLLHSHLSGRKLKLRHFRGGQELPWIAYDDTYDFNFQQNQNLREEVEIHPGDQLTFECTYDTTWNENKVVQGGLSTREEMCVTYLWVYGETTLENCFSMVDVDDVMDNFGVTNYTVTEVGGNLIFEILEPEDLKGDLTNMLNNVFNWTDEFITKTEAMNRYGNHFGMCRTGPKDEDMNVFVNTTYPEIEKPFEFVQECSGSAHLLAAPLSLSVLLASILVKLLR